MKFIFSWFAINNKPDHYKLSLLFMLTLFAGLIFSHALQSISMGLLVANTLVNKEARKNINEYFSDPVLIILSLFFLTFLLSGIYSEDKQYWLQKTNVRLAFILIPLGMITLRSMTHKTFQWLLYFFMWMLVISSICVLINYLENYDAVNGMYSAGQTMETPYSHVRFSLLVCFAVFIGWYLYQGDFQPLFRGEKYLTLIATIFLIVFLHVMAVRSGLLAFYLCAIFLLLRSVFIFRKWKRGFLALLLLLLLPFVAYNFFPSVKTKVQYMKYDLDQYFSFNQTAGLSDATRLLSMKNGIEIWKENIWIGVGAGDVKNEALKKYVDPEIKTASKLPHNQIVWELASVGVIGFVLFWFASLFPFFYNRNYADPLFVCLHIILFSSYLTEATIDDSNGNGLYLLFLVLIYFQLRKKKG
ncbi:MAG: O-antigen ligase family protein [Bacteroidota bacterium]